MLLLRHARARRPVPLATTFQARTRPAAADPELEAQPFLVPATTSVGRSEHTCSCCDTLERAIQCRWPPRSRPRTRPAAADPELEAQPFVAPAATSVGRSGHTCSIAAPSPERECKRPSACPCWDVRRAPAEHVLDRASEHPSAAANVRPHRAPAEHVLDRASEHSGAAERPSPPRTMNSASVPAIVRSAHRPTMRAERPAQRLLVGARRQQHPAHADHAAMPSVITQNDQS